MKTSYRYLKKKYKKIYTKKICDVCKKGFLIARYTKRHPKYNSNWIGDALFEGVCYAGHSLCPDCVFDSCFNIGVCEEHEDLI